MQRNSGHEAGAVPNRFNRANTLAPAIAMRMWAEERRTGTLEFVVTLPASGWEFVVGKFLACWLLLGLALLLAPATIAQAAPTPGGLGAVEAALIAGLGVQCRHAVIPRRADEQCLAGDLDGACLRI